MGTGTAAALDQRDYERSRSILRGLIAFVEEGGRPDILNEVLGDAGEENTTANITRLKAIISEEGRLPNRLVERLKTVRGD